MQRTCRTSSCLRRRSTCHVEIGVFLCVSSTVPFVSISLSVPRARIHRPLPRRDGWSVPLNVSFLRFPPSSISIDRRWVCWFRFVPASIGGEDPIHATQYDRKRRMEVVWFGSYCTNAIVPVPFVCLSFFLSMGWSSFWFLPSMGSPVVSLSGGEGTW